MFIDGNYEFTRLHHPYAGIDVLVHRLTRFDTRTGKKNPTSAREIYFVEGPDGGVTVMRGDPFKGQYVGASGTLLRAKALAEALGKHKMKRSHSSRDTHRFTAAERSGRAAAMHKLAKRGGSHTYATPEVKRTASYKRAERLEEQLAPQRWHTKGLTRSQYEKLADAWERAGFLGWADNYRAHVEHHKIGRDPGKRHRHRTPSAPSFAKQKLISRKIRLLVREGYDRRQAAAIAYRMYGASRKA